MAYERARAEAERREAEEVKELRRQGKWIDHYGRVWDSPLDGSDVYPDDDDDD